MDKIDKPFERKSQKYRNRYMDALNELYRDTEDANNAIGNSLTGRSSEKRTNVAGKARIA
jgi:hypothetical protein